MPITVQLNYSAEAFFFPEEKRLKITTNKEVEQCVTLTSTDRVKHTHMVYREVWPSAAVGQQEREGWVGAEQKGEDSRVAHSPNTCTWSLGSHSDTSKVPLTDQWTNILITSCRWLLPSGLKLLERLKQAFRNLMSSFLFFSFVMFAQRKSGSVLK